MIFMETTSIGLRLFYSSSVSVPLVTANTSRYDHKHERTPCAPVMIFMETPSIWLLLFYSSSASASLPTTTTPGRKMNFNKRNFGHLTDGENTTFYPRRTSMQSSIQLQGLSFETETEISHSHRDLSNPRWPIAAIPMSAGRNIPSATTTSTRHSSHTRLTRHSRNSKLTIK